MSSLSAFELYLLELINQARMDPAAEAARQGVSLNQGLPAGTISSLPKQVLAPNGLLHSAADSHTNSMVAHDPVSKHDPASFPRRRTGWPPFDRMTAAGYAFDPAPVGGENIAWRGSTGGPIDTQATF